MFPKRDPCIVHLKFFHWCVTQCVWNSSVECVEHGDIGNGILVTVTQRGQVDGGISPGEQRNASTRQPSGSHLQNWHKESYPLCCIALWSFADHIGTLLCVAHCSIILERVELSPRGVTLDKPRLADLADLAPSPPLFPIRITVLYLPNHLWCCPTWDRLDQSILVG